MYNLFICCSLKYFIKFCYSNASSFDDDHQIADPWFEPNDPLPENQEYSNVDMIDTSEHFCICDHDVLLPSSEFCETEQSIYGSLEDHVDSDWKTFPITVEQADEVCIKLNDLIKRGLISKERILYKYLNDTVCCLMDVNHPYDDEVIQFFNTLEYLGGESVVNFLRGPMYHGSGRGGVKNPEDANPNFGGPSKTTRQKAKGGYTTSSGVIKAMHLGFLKFITEGANKVEPLIDSAQAKIYGTVLQNDGTALQPGIQFNDFQKQNVGLKTKVDLKFVKENPSPSPEFLKENVITEANVSLLTTLCDAVTMPVYMEYMGKTGKDGNGMLQMFTEQISTLQCCKRCVENTASIELISKCSGDVCVRKCPQCIKDKTVCDECKMKGHTNYSPSLRACNRCLKNNEQCVRLTILALSIDCEEGNKKAMEILEAQQKEGTNDPELEFCVFLPDGVHVGKSLKCSFANWFCLFDGNRISLAVLNTLRDDSDPIIRGRIRNVLTKEDVQNKDRMAVDPILRLSSTSVQEILLEIQKPVIHTLIPDKYKVNDTNKVGMYPHPIFVSTGPKGKLIFLDYQPLKKESKLCMADLHCPVRVQVLKSSLKDARNLTYQEKTGLAFVVERENVVAVVEVTGKRSLQVKTLKLKKLIQEELRKRGASDDGTIVQLKERLEKILRETMKTWKESDTPTDTLKMDVALKVDVVCKLSEDMLAVASNKDANLSTVTTTLDGVGVCGCVKNFAPYPEMVKDIVDMCVTCQYLIVAHKNGIGRFSLETRQYVTLLSNNTNVCMSVGCISPYEEDRVVFTDTVRRGVSALSITSGEVQLIAGGEREGNSDGTCATFSQPMGICVEFKKNIFITDSQVGAIKLLANVRAVVTFLKSLGMLYDAFSVHLKHKRKAAISLSDAHKALMSVSNYLALTVKSVQTLLNTQRITNGPEGTVSNKTVISVLMLEKGIARLAANVCAINNKVQVRPESLLSVKVENFHAVSHFKHPTCLVLSYARDFGATVLESAKRMSLWSAYYFTHPSSYYPVASTQIHLKDVPKMPQQNKTKMSSDDMAKMQQWAREHGKCVRQRTVRQENTKYKAGTLPLNMYQSDRPTGEPLVLESSQPEEDQISEYDSESDEESLHSAESSENEVADVESSNPDVALGNREVNFLFCKNRTRSGRRIKTTDRTMLWM